MTRTSSRLLGLASTAALVLGAAGCGDDTTDGAATTVAPVELPSVTIALSDGTIDAPAEIPGGIVEIQLEAAAGEQSHHLLFARLNDGVTYDDLEAAGDGLNTLVTFRGGNGSLAPGASTRLVLDLPAGDYEIIDLPEGEVAAMAPTTVAEETDAAEPDARGTVALGPGMVIRLPGGFDGSGLWEFDNQDETEPHEAALLALAPGQTVEDAMAWATTFAGPPPGDLIGGFGALGPSLHGWADLGEALPAGDYALICLIPGVDDAAHAAHGMVAGFTVD